MAASDMSLGAHWDRFIDKQVATGRYSSAGEVIREALRALEAREAKLSLLIAHLEAGDTSMDEMPFVEDLSLEHFDRTIKTNLYGYFHMAKAVVPYLEHGSAIINTGSVTGLLGSKELLDYSTTKGGIHAFTRSLAQSLIEKGIRVNAVAPGPVWTPLNPADKKAEKVAEFGADVPMKRPAQPEELSPIYVFLAAPVCSSYITGEIFPVIGGYSGS